MRRASRHLRHYLGCGSSVVLLLLLLGGCHRSRLSLDQVIEQNVSATGGRAAIEAVRSIEVDLHIADPKFEADGIYRAARPGKMRIDIMSAGKHVFTEAFNGERGWEWRGKGEVVECTPKATAALRHGIELPGKLFGLHEMQARGHQVALAPKERVDGIDYEVIRLVLADGYVTSLYIDPVSGLIVRRRDIRPLHVDIDPTPTTIEAKSFDFRDVEGVVFAFSGADMDLQTGKVLERTTIRSIKINQPIEDQFFDRL
jgi:hypothetical protein